MYRLIAHQTSWDTRAWARELCAHAIDPEEVRLLYCGSCHCGAVAFEVEAGFLHLIVPKRDFKLLRGADALTTCTFKKKAKVDYLAHIEQLHSCATMASGAYCGLSVELLV